MRRLSGGCGCGSLSVFVEAAAQDFSAIDIECGSGSCGADTDFPAGLEQERVAEVRARGPKRNVVCGAAASGIGLNHRRLGALRRGGLGRSCSSWCGYNSRVAADE